MEHRIIITEVTAENEHIETTPRPQCLRNYVGQGKIKSILNIYVEAVKARGEFLDHVLSYSPPGLGEAALADIIVNEIGTNTRVTSGPATEKLEEMVVILNNLQEGDVFFVDETCCPNRQAEEVLYLTMEDLAIDTILGKDSTVRSVRLDLPHSTLVGATIKAGLFIMPLRDWFGMIQRLEFYALEELKIITLYSARVLGVEVEARGAMGLARRSRGTPRLANRLLKRVRDFAWVKHDGVIIREVTDFALDIMDVDKPGLGQNDRNILLMIIEKSSGGSVRLDTLATALGEDSGASEEVYGSYLLMSGLVNCVPRGRMATETACRHLGLEMQKPPC